MPQPADQENKNENCIYENTGDRVWQAQHLNCEQYCQKKPGAGSLQNLLPRSNNAVLLIDHVLEFYHRNHGEAIVTNVNIDGVRDINFIRQGETLSGL